MNQKAINTMSEEQLEAVREYYRNKNVRTRIREFCGGDPFTCEYLVGFGQYLARNGYRRPLRLSDEPDELESMMEEGLDLFRSVWDTRSDPGGLGRRIFQSRQLARALPGAAQTF